MHNFEFNIERYKSSSNNGNSLWSNEKFEDHNPCIFASKVTFFMINLAKQLFFTNEEKRNKFIEEILKE